MEKLQQLQITTEQAALLTEAHTGTLTALYYHSLQVPC